VKSQYRLNGHSSFRRVWSEGLSVSISFLLLLYLPNSLEISRFGVAAGKSLGSAVLRNRAKRRIRACFQEISPKVKTGWDILVVARRQVIRVDYLELNSSMTKLFAKADLLKDV
jgi:ribonuclease P protein component